MQKMFYLRDNIFGLTGYSKAVRELGYAMSKKTKVAFLPLNHSFGYAPEKIYPLLSNLEPTSSDTVFWRPYFTPHPKKGQLIANIALESTQLPERMVKETNNDRVVQVWCPSKFCYDNYVNSGIIEDKLRIVPHGFLPHIFKFKSTPINKPFRFLFVGGYTGPNDRKGADLLVKAFTEEFKSGEAELYLKINTSYGDVSKELAIRKDIIIDTKFYLDKDIVDLYHKADCYVLPTQGEAFDMSILEAAACGLPIICGGWGGHRDYLDNFGGRRNTPIYYLESNEAIPRFSPWDCGKWRKPTLDSLKQCMRDIWKWPLPKKPYPGIEEWTWDKAAEGAVNYLRELRN